MSRKLLLPTCGVALALLTAVLAAPAVAGADPATPPAPSSSAIEGVVTSVNWPFNPQGSGPIVTLLDGLVSFDAFGAKVHLGDGAEGSIEDIKPGRRVVALLAPFDGTGMPHAQTVVVQGDAKAVRLSGVLQAVDPDARTITLLGLTVKVTEKTVIGGPRDGAAETDLSGLKAGDQVLVDAIEDSGALAALKILKLAPVPLPVERIHGTVKSIGTESWVITPVSTGPGPAYGPTVVPADVTVKITAETKITGNPQVGDVVDVLAQRTAAGELVALAILKVTPPAPQPLRFHGWVTSIADGAWVLSFGPPGSDAPTGTSAAEVLLKVTAETRIEGNPQVGDEVDAVAQKSSTGELVALSIVKFTPPPPPVVQFHGKVVAIGAVVWRIQPMSDGPVIQALVEVAVTAETKILGNPQVGDEVDVIARGASSGPAVALQIKKSITTPAPVVRIHGKVKSISPDAWVISPLVATAGPTISAVVPDVRVKVTNATKFTGNPRVGDEVDVEAQADASGVLVALLIAKSPNTTPGPAVVAFDGTVQSIQGSLWMIDRVRVSVSKTTVLTGEPRVKDRVHVEGTKAADGTVLALSIRKL